jgi:hypothetical protein
MKTRREESTWKRARDHSFFSISGSFQIVSNLGELPGLPTTLGASGAKLGGKGRAF